MKKRAAFSIWEMLFVLAMVGVLFVLASQAFTTTMRVLNQAGPSTEPPMRFDAAIAQLRADVLASAAIEMPERNKLVIHQANQGVVIWQAEKSELTRSDSGPVRVWQVGRPIEISTSGAMVLVQPANSVDPGEQIALSSWRQIVGGREQ
jgi:hypothetical protein